MQTADGELIFPVGKDFTLTADRMLELSNVATGTLRRAQISRGAGGYGHAQASCIFRNATQPLLRAFLKTRPRRFVCRPPQIFAFYRYAAFT